MLTPKENALKLFRHQMPEFLPIYGEGIINNVPVNGFQERPSGGKGGYDWFGVHWQFIPGDPAPVPGPDYLLDDICKWQRVVKFPDLDAFDWEKAKEIDRITTFDRENNLLYQIVHNGIFERLNALMGFENSLMSLLEEPEVCAEYFMAMADYKCRLIAKLAEHYRPDIISYHDDWGTQLNLFFSPQVWRELIKPATKKIVDCVHSHGIIFELHCDGMIKDLVPEIVDDLHVDSIQLMAINDIPSLKKKTGNKVVYNVFINNQKYETIEKLNEETLRKEVRQEVMSQGEGGCYLPSFLLLDPKWEGIIFDEVRQCQKVLYQG
ncbi:MAG: uroporphyrinogen decarboxylase family protein [Desulfopila sp.]